jgi:accessory gene regulator B
MIYKLIGDKIISNISKDIDMEHRDIYAYCLERYLSNVINFIVFTIIAIVFRVPVETIVFALFYCPIRSYAGGLHARTRTMCMILSILSLLGLIHGARWLGTLPYWRALGIILLVIACLLIIRIGPVDSPGRRLEESTRLRYRRKIMWIVIVDSLVLVAGICILEAYRSFVLLGILAMLLEGGFLLPKVAIPDD